MTTNCPQCRLPYEYDNDTDSYHSAEEVQLSYGMPREVTGYICKCGEVIALVILDKYGMTLYVPCEESP